MNDFVHLHVHTEYSLLNGACKINDLVAAVKSAGQAAVAITDHGVMYGVVEFYRECLDQGIKPIIGCEVYIAPRGRLNKPAKEKPYHLTLLCKDNLGYQNLMRLVSDSHISGYYNYPRCDKETLKKYREGLIALSGCAKGEISQKLLMSEYSAALSAALEYKEIFDDNDFYIELYNHRISEELGLSDLLRKIAAESDIPLMASNNVHYISREDNAIHRALTAIGTGGVIDSRSAVSQSADNSERYLKTGAEMATLFGDTELENTKKIAERCNVTFEFGVYRLPLFEKDGVVDNYSYFVDSIHAGLRDRYGAELSDEVIKRSEYEISVISKMGFVDYYLIVADFIGFARDNGIPVGPGRGSGVGSICAYALKITSVDPIRFNLLFERFLNPERVSMPDFDIDFCYLRRGEVIDYVTRKYGSSHVAQIITFGTMAARSAIRDAARVMNLPYGKADKIAKLIPFSFNPNLKKSLEEEKELKVLYVTDTDSKKVIDIALKIEGMPRHPSVHAAGIVLTREPLTDYLPLQKSGNDVITQYSMGDLERLGLLKMDFLGLRYLTVIDKVARAVNINLYKIKEADTNIYDMLSNGGTVGVFQFESEGMTAVLSRLKPRSIEDLIATISLYRPGPMQSISKYIENRHNTEKITYKHPLLKDILEVTYGCIVYQEQVMEICRRLAGFSYGRADLVRRAMSKKKREVMENERASFIKGAIETVNIEEDTAKAIFEELSGFASYAFNKSHAAAYAYISYQTAYLRFYHYKEYMTQLMTSVLDHQSSLIKYRLDMEKQGIRLLPPDVNKSFAEFSSEEEGIRLGLLAIKNLGRAAIECIINERKAGPFTSIYDFLKRINGRELNKRTVESLIKSGALDGFSYNRRTMLSVYESIMESLSFFKGRNVAGQLSFFDTGDVVDDEFEIKFKEEFPLSGLIEFETETIGFSFSGHTRQNSYSAIYVNINSDNHELHIKIIDLAKRNPGSANLRICFKDTKEVKSINGLRGIKITNTFIKELSKLCGKDNIKLI